MVALLWETALLLLGAYFLGAFFGCMIRRLISSGAPEDAAGPAMAAASTGVVAAGVAAAGSGSRFDQALTGDGRSGAPAGSWVNRDAELVEPKIETLSPQLGERASSDATPPSPAATASAPDQESAEQIKRDPFGTVGAVVGPGAGAAAALATAAFARSGPDGDNDLRDIRRIDDDTARRLRTVGVSRWADIANWSSADVAGIEAELGLGGRIQREAWIEQASILAAGGSTAFAAKRMLGVVDTSESAPVVPPTKQEPTAEAPPSIDETRGEEPDEREASAATLAAAAAAGAAVAGAATASRSDMSESDHDDLRIAATETTRWDEIQEISSPNDEASSMEEEPPPVEDDRVAAEPATDPEARFDEDMLPRATGSDGTAVTSSWPDETDRDAEEVATPSDDADENRWTWDASDVPADQEIARRSDPDPFGEDTDLVSPDADPGASFLDDDQVVSTPGIAAGGAAALAGIAALATGSRGDSADENNAQADRVSSEPVSGLRSVRSEALVGDQAMPLQQDDLKRIRGVGVREETRLRKLGVTTYAQIAGWSADDVAVTEKELVLGGRISRENWIEQAQMLQGGTPTEFAKRRDRGETDTVPVVAVTPPIAQESLGAEATGNPDLSGALDPQEEDGPSIADRIATIAPMAADEPSDGNIGDDTDTQVVNEPRDGTPFDDLVDGNASDDRLSATDTPDATESSAAPVASAAALRSVRSAAFGPEGADRTDDLKRIRGIGVLIEKRLHAMGITTYEQVANWTETDIARVNVELAFQNRIEREKWIEQARILASGGQTEFSRRLDRGEV